MEGINRLKSEFDGDLFLICCGELARHLLSQGVVDELRFRIHPAISGDGSRPYAGDRVRMRSLGSTGYPSGVTLLRFEPIPA